MIETTAAPSAGPASAASGKAGNCATADGLDLYWRSWTPAQPVGVIVIIHGLAEHGGRYQETAEAFVSSGWAVYAGDLRGHGQSPDVPGAGRVHVNRFTDYFRDVEAFVKLARENHDGLPLFLLGHSMGGLITISYVLQSPTDLAGAIISSPALGTHPDFKPPALLRLLVRVLDRLAPRLRFPSDLDTNAISRDPDVVRAYIDDPLISEKVSARWYAEILRAIDQAHANARRLQIPLLLMQSGADRLVDPAAPARWVQAASAGGVELVNWAGFYHEMFNEPEKKQVQRRALDWLQQRLAQQAATPV
jgi:alpha-beta hydrolase superfamily lysophospholipase